MTHPSDINLLEDNECLKTEAATLAQLARDLYDGEEITPEAALNRLHEECMTATAKTVRLDLERRRLRDEVERLKAELEEARLTLLAEQGALLVAPDPLWRWLPMERAWTYPLVGGGRLDVRPHRRGGQRWTSPWGGGLAPTARAGMIAARAATASPDQPSPAGGA